MSRKLSKAYLKENPQVVDSSFAMSDACAQTLLDAVEFPGFESMIEGAKAKADIPPEEWAAVDEVIRKRSRAKRLLSVFNATGVRRVTDSKANT